MAVPATDRGFVMVPLDLLGAIAAGKMDSLSGAILAEVVTQVLGPMKAESARIDLSGMAELLGTDRRNLRRSLRVLEEGGVLRRRPDGTYDLVSDWEGWSPGGERFDVRLGGGFARWVASLVGRFGVRRRRGSDHTPSAHPEGVGSYPREGSDRTPARGRIVPPRPGGTGSDRTPVTTSTGVGSYPLPIYEMRENENETGECEQETPAPLTARSDGTRTPDPESSALIDWAGTLGYDDRHLSYSEFAARQAADPNTPRAWIWTLLWRRAANQPRPARVSLLIQILNDWRMTGRPEVELVPAPWSRPTPDPRIPHMGGEATLPAAHPEGTFAERMARLRAEHDSELNGATLT